MDSLVLFLTGTIPFPSCLFRMKKYNIPLWKMLVIYISVFIVSAVGACIWSALGGGSILGKRLYGVMLINVGLLPVLSALLKIELSVMGDFVAAPLMFVCFAAKIDCIVNGCCYGFTLYQLEMQQPVRFPSAFLEMSIWAIMAVLLLLIEKFGKAKGLLWPIALIWFGITRFLVDFLRGSALEKEILLLGMTGGQFWSLVTAIIGFVWMSVAITRKNNQRPSVGLILKAVIGRGS